MGGDLPSWSNVIYEIPVHLGERASFGPIAGQISLLFTSLQSYSGKLWVSAGTSRKIDFVAISFHSNSILGNPG